MRHITARMATPQTEQNILSVQATVVPITSAQHHHNPTYGSDG